MWRSCVWFLVVLSLGLASACTRFSAVDKADTILVQISSEPVSLDPALAEDGMALRILNNTMDGLMGYDRAGRLEGRLARSVGQSPNGLRYDFVMREAFWSDGRKVTAEDFVVGIRRSLAPGTGSKLAGLLFPIRGARRFHSGALQAEQLGVRVEGDRLVIELEKPVSYWLDVMTLPVALPSRTDVLESNGGRWPDMGPVTGPYRIAKRQFDQYLYLRPNERYWGFQASAGLPASVLLRLITDETTAITLFEKGEIDILGKVPASDLPRLSKQGVVHTDPFVATYYISFNVTKPPFNRREYRRAVAAAIRKEEIVQALGVGDFPARSWIPRGLEGHVPYSGSAARTSGHSVLSVKKPHQSVEAMFDGNARNQLVMEKIQQDLKRAIPELDLQLSHMDWKSYSKLLATDAPPLFRYGRQAPFMDPISHLEAFVSADPNNFSRWSHPGYDRLVERIVGLPKGPTREALIRKADALLVEQEAVVVPIYHYVQLHAVSRRIEGFRVSPFGIVRFDELRIRSVGSEKR